MDIQAINKTLPHDDQIVTRRILAEELVIFKESMNEKFDFLLETIDEKFTTLTGVMVEKINDMFKANMEGIDMKIEAIDRSTEELRILNERLDRQNNLTQVRINRLENKVFKKKLS